MFLTERACPPGPITEVHFKQHLKLRSRSRDTVENALLVGVYWSVRLAAAAAVGAGIADIVRHGLIIVVADRLRVLGPLFLDPLDP